MGREKKIVTMQELADKAGVSRPVVSAILNGHRTASMRYSDKTRDRVLKLAKRMNYRPNRNARNFVRKKHGIIDVVVDSIFQIPQQTLQAMLNTAEKEFGQLIHLDMILRNEEWQPLCLREDAADGVILIGNTDRDLDRRIEAIGIPCLRLNCNRRGKPDCIDYDEKDAMHEVFSSFRKAGRRQIAMLSKPDRHYSESLRRRILRKLAAEKRLPKPVFLNRDKRGDYAEIFEDVLLENPDIDAVVVHESQLMELYAVCRKLKRRIGRDISVIALHGNQICRAVYPPATDIHPPYYNLGEIAIRKLNQMINGEKVRPTIIKYELWQQ